MSKPRAAVKFVYLYCRDLEAMRRFYADLLGLEQKGYRSDAAGGWLACDCGGFELAIMQAVDLADPPAGWASQPGVPGGDTLSISWSVAVPEKDYPATITALQAAGTPALASQPRWVNASYWSFAVKDPAGNTVDVYCEPAARPTSTRWPAPRSMA